MRKTILTYGLKMFLLLMFLPLPQKILAQKELSEIYTKESPLTVIVDWDFAPYEFNNTYGEMTGYIIDVLNAVFKKMDIEYTLETSDWKKAKDMFSNGEIEVIVDPYHSFNDSIFHYSNVVLSNLDLGFAQRMNSPTLTDISQLKDAKSIQVRFEDSVAVKTLRTLLPNTDISYSSVKYALTRIKSGEEPYLAWGTHPLKWKIREFGMEEELKVSKLSIHIGEFRLASTNEILVKQFDDTYARMEQSGDIQIIHDKWFNPESLNKNAPYIVFIYIAIAIVIVILFIYSIQRIHKKERRLNRRAEEIEHMMRTALNQGDYNILELDVAKGILLNKYGSLLPDKGISEEEMYHHFHPEDRDDFMQHFNALKNGELSFWNFNARWQQLLSKDYIYIQGYAVAEKDSNGKVHHIVGTLKDVTNSVEQQKRDVNLANRLIKMFDSALVAMSFYSKDGHLIYYNSNMRELCAIDIIGDELFRNTKLQDMPLLKEDYSLNSFEPFFVCQHFILEEANINKYLEFRISPTIEQGEIVHYLITARDVTYEREIYLKLRKQQQEVHQTNNQIHVFERELSYLLENSNMWVWSSNLENRTTSFSRNLHKNDFTLTFEQFLNNIFEDQREIALKELGGMLGEDINFNVTLHLLRSPVNENPQWIAISGIPMHDEQGKLIGHFGIVRDVTKLMEAQEQLKLETKRAEDSGKLKSIFLANMTHEIRTPLNAIVGFSDLLQVINDSNERKEFIRIIRNNCDMLMRLINDIIEASNMNDGPLSIETEEVDFANAFNDICQTLAQRVEEPEVEFIVDNPYTTLVADIDKGRLQQVITNFVTNAVKYTKKGHIKVGFRQEENVRTDNGTKSQGIYMYCEDTGLGIPKDKQSTVFDRFVKLNDFVQGTGLGLSICKSIADRCGGKVGVNSEGENQGSTFWIWIPCEIKESN